MSRFNRGATLVEVLVAAAVLAIGLSAIAAVLTQTSLSSRTGLRKGEVALAGASTLDDWSCRGYANLSEGLYDAGTVFSAQGVPLYEQTMTVTSLADAGVSGYRLQLDVSWNDVTFGASQAVKQWQRYETIVTGGFDGG